MSFMPLIRLKMLSLKLKDFLKMMRFLSTINLNISMSMVKTSELEKKAVQIRLDTLNALYKGDLGYAGSCMSVVEILVALYYGELFGSPVMKYDCTKPGSGEQDYLILSKGQAVPVQYSVLADLGFFDKSELNFVGKPGSMLTARPN